MIGCIIQARMGSTRLPNKIMKVIDGMNPSLLYTINQLKNTSNIEKIVVATTSLEEDDVVEEFCSKNNIDVYRGSSENVLDRFYNCSKKFDFKIIVRITADCPLIDPKIVDSFIESFIEENYDYVHNFIPRTFPDGIDIEVFSFTSLKIAWKNAVLPSEKEHVTPYFRNNHDKFKIKNIVNDEDLSNYRITLDYEEDLRLLREIISRIKHRPIFLRDVISLLKKDHNLVEINRKFSANEGFQLSLEKDKIFRENLKEE